MFFQSHFLLLARLIAQASSLEMATLSRMDLGTRRNLRLLDALISLLIINKRIRRPFVQQGHLIGRNAQRSAS